jgi:hypothetical protein
VQELERDLAPQLLILSQVHVRHPASAEARDYLVSPVDQ